MNMTCPSCGAVNAAQSRFCFACGNALASAAVTAKTIPQLLLHAGGKPVSGHTTIPRPALMPQMTLPTRIRPAPVQREHLVLVKDISPSMGNKCNDMYTKLQAAVRASAALVLEKSRIDPQDLIGLVTFDSHAYANHPCVSLADGKTSILQALQLLNTDTDGTDINEGLKAARDLFDWSQNGVVRRIVLLTDGQGGHPLKTAEDLKSRGVIIDVTGVGDSPSNVDEKLLKKVASVVNGELRYRFIKDQRTLLTTYTSIAGKTQIA